MESILSRVLQANERPSVASGLRLLQLCLAYQPADPLIFSTLLTCISALFVFLSMSTGQMAPTGKQDKIYYHLGFMVFQKDLKMLIIKTITLKLHCFIILRILSSY